MHRTHHVTRFLGASFGLHLLFFAAILFLAGRASRPLEVTPVNIVDLPKSLLEQLPPIQTSRTLPQPPPTMVRPLLPLPQTPPPQSVPIPERFGTAPDISIPGRTPGGEGRPDASGQGTADTDRSKLGSADSKRGPLPFLTQADIDQLARKGMPERKPGDNSVTLDTDEFKFISYNRWLKIKVESVLRYPELAALSGLQGTLYIQFDILKDGSLGNLELLKSSGYKILDDEALRSIRAAAPFQPLPADWHMERYPIRAAVLFYLSGAYIR